MGKQLTDENKLSDRRKKGKRAKKEAKRGEAKRNTQTVRLVRVLVCRRSAEEATDDKGILSKRRRYSRRERERAKCN